MKTRYRTVVAALVAVCAIGLCLFFVLLRPSGLYQVTVLPSLGGDAMAAHAINDRGQVVGVAQMKDGLYHLFLWDREHGVRDLGVTGDVRFDINNAGQIAGAMIDPNGNQQACLWEPGKPPMLLGTLGGRTSQAMSINNRGQIAGASAMPNGSRHAFFWDRAHGMKDLGTLGETESHANRINDVGRVLGVSHTPQQRLRPFIWDANEGMVVVEPSQIDAGFFAINRGSWIVGQVASQPSNGSIAIWRKGEAPRRVCPLDGFLGGMTLLNDANQIVFHETPARQSGWRILRRLFPPPARHYLWDPKRGKILLEAYLGVGRKEVFAPTDINNNGCIVGIVASGPKMSRQRSILLEPIRERWSK